MIEMKLEDKWWEQAKLPSKWGGMGLRTGIHTTGAQHISSLAKCDDDIAKFVPNWDGHRVAVESTSVWLMKHLEAEVDIEAMFDQIKKGKIEGTSLSVSQSCEAKQAKRVLRSMSPDEQLHIRSNCGPGCAWVK